MKRIWVTAIAASAAMVVTLFLALSSAFGGSSGGLVNICHALPPQAPFDYVFITVPAGPAVDAHRDHPGDKIGVSGPADCGGTVANAGTTSPAGSVNVCHALPPEAPFRYVFITVPAGPALDSFRSHPGDVIGVTSPADCPGSVANAGDTIPAGSVNVCHALPGQAPFDYVFVTVPAGPALDAHRDHPGDIIGVASPSDCPGSVANAGGTSPPGFVNVCHALPGQAPFDYVFVTVPAGPALDSFRLHAGDIVGVASPSDCPGSVANAGVTTRIRAALCQRGKCIPCRRGARLTASQRRLLGRRYGYCSCTRTKSGALIRCRAGKRAVILRPRGHP